MNDWNKLYAVIFGVCLGVIYLCANNVSCGCPESSVEAKSSVNVIVANDSYTHYSIEIPILFYNNDGELYEIPQTRNFNIKLDDYKTIVKFWTLQEDGSYKLMELIIYQ